MEDQGIVRVEKGKHHPYTVVSNTLVQDESLSWQARGLMVYLLSKPDNWRVRMDDLERAGGVGRQQTRSILTELEGAGYVRRRRVHLDGGRFDWETTVYESPQQEEAQAEFEEEITIDEPTIGRSPTDGPATDGQVPDIVSTDVPSTDARRDANASPPRPARAASPEERQHRAVRTAVREFFEVESGLTIPSAGKTRHLGALWWAPIREICELNDYDLGAAKDTVKTALDRLRGKTVSDPNSILKTARAVVGERKRGVTGKTEAKATTAWKRY